MPLQNRVDPFGQIVAHPARGLLMGNRGIIHDAATRSLLRRRWTSKAWIICLCSFKGRRRVPMSPGTYTELFFLDEATALAAGHRPCFECQRGRAKDFAACFATGNGRAAMRAGAIDSLLHAERRATGAHSPILSRQAPDDLPDGAMVATGDAAFVKHEGRFLRWSFGGYTAGQTTTPSGNDRFTLLTPPSTIRAIRAGFRPGVHPSAAAAT